MECLYKAKNNDKCIVKEGLSSVTHLKKYRVKNISSLSHTRLVCWIELSKFKLYVTITEMHNLEFFLKRAEKFEIMREIPPRVRLFEMPEVFELFQFPIIRFIEIHLYLRLNLLFPQKNNHILFIVLFICKNIFMLIRYSMKSESVHMLKVSKLTLESLFI